MYQWYALDETKARGAFPLADLGLDCGEASAPSYSGSSIHRASPVVYPRGCA